MQPLNNKLSQILLSGRQKNKTAALILAAGNSTRMGGTISKQLMELYGVPVLAYTLSAYQASPMIREIIVAARKEDFAAIAKIRKEYRITKLHTVVAGGRDRQESAARAFAKIRNSEYVAIADGARCLIQVDEINEVCSEAYRYRAASAACRLVGTVKRTTGNGFVTETLDRSNLWEAQTPQVFHVSLYASAMEQAAKDGWRGTDDNSLVERIGSRIQLVECSRENMKITTPEDMRIAEAILAARVNAAEGDEE